MRKCKYDYIVGIDPDVEKSGVAFLAVGSKTLQLRSLTLPELLKSVSAYVDQFDTEVPPLSFETQHKAVVVVEIDRDHCHNWHLLPEDTKNSAASKGFDQGRCFHVAEAICEILRSEGIEVIEKAPLLKIWSGPDRKISHAELTSLKGLNIIREGKRSRSSQEQRDAALLALDISEIPLILPPDWKKNR